ncbi:MAG: hypothetical protein IAE82_18695 [Opitutaceae bacterium]|nr:hypothetical protein [Opitutaceae bacterium]
MNTPATPQTAPWPFRRWVLALACFLAVFGARVWFVDRFGSDLPTWDQWGAEGESLLLPFEQGRLRLADLFIPHNEHRVVATKLLALGLYRVNGQWDARLECVTNAAMVGVFVAVLFLFGRRLVPPRWELAWLAALLALFAAPMSWQNILGGFHTQQTFLIAFSFAAIAGLGTCRALSAGWWLGGLAAFAALFTMGSGLLAAAAAAATVILTYAPREVVRRHAVTVVVCGAVVALGLRLHTSVSYHDYLKAHSVQDFLLCFWRSLQWPQVKVPVYGLVSWLPWAIVAWTVRRRGEAAPAGERLLTGAGIWVLLQFAASAYARGADGAWPADRYLDTVAFGIALNLLALLRLLSRTTPTGWRRPVRALACVAGAGMLAHGWWGHVSRMIGVEGPTLRAEHIDREQHTRAYLLTGDPSWLKEGHIPYPNAYDLRKFLDHDEIRRVLPASVRAPIAVPGMAAPDGGFVVPGLPAAVGTLTGWPMVGTFAVDGAATTATWQSGPLPQSRFSRWLLPTVSETPNASGLQVEILEGPATRPIVLSAANDPRLPHPGWNLAVVAAPGAGALLRARDASPDAWLAVGAPVEMAPGSYWAWQLARCGLSLFWTGVIGAACLGLGLVAPGVSAAALLARWRTTVARQSRRSSVAVAAAAAAVAGGMAFLATDPRDPAFFVATIRGDLKGNSVELFYDRGHGIRGADSAQCWFDHDLHERAMRLPLPAGNYRKLRFDPMDYGAATLIEAPRIEDADGSVLLEITPAMFEPRRDIADVRAQGRDTLVVATPDGGDPQLMVALTPKLRTIPIAYSPWPRRIVIVLSAILAAVLAPLAIAWITARRAPAHTEPKTVHHPA